ncbi:MAG: phage terminase large subunit [Candidatus Omnitrophica bacterium]|nr:phage terminase large subunit [Candidatus Omnitrophota bacterium]
MGKIIDMRGIARSIVKLRRGVGMDFQRFRKYYFSEYHKKPDGIFQREISDILSDVSKKRGAHIAVAAPRGFAKSTIVSLEYVIYCICHKREKFIVIISSTADTASAFLRDIKREIESNARLAEDFPEICDVNKRVSGVRWSENEIITPNGIKIIALGTGQQIRGRRNLSERPTLIILDDIETTETCRNPESAYRLEDWLKKSVLQAGSENTNIIYIGTIHHYNSLLARFTDPKQTPGWIQRIYKAILAFNERTELWGQWSKIYHILEEYNCESGPDAAKKYFNDNKIDMLSGVQLLWPEGRSYYEFMVIKEREGEYSFNSEYQNEPVNEKDCIFNLNDTYYWEDEFKTEEELFEKIGRSILIFGACDPSLGKEVDSGDFSAIITVAFYDVTRTAYVLDVDVARRRPSSTIDTILEYAKFRRYTMFGFESNQFQEVMADYLMARADELRRYFTVEKVVNTANKRVRIDSLQPLFKSGKIKILRKHRALIEEMRFYPKGGHDDALDALQIAVKLANENTFFGGIWSL